MPTANVTVQMEPGETEADANARAFLSPGIRQGLIALGFGSQAFGGGQSPPTLDSVVTQLRMMMNKTVDGDNTMATSMLVAQAAALDSMFTEMGRRALLNANDYPEAAEKYIRLALKTQARCTATLEAISNIQRPTIETTRHVKVAGGGQAIIADQFHHHAGVSQDGKADDQSHATAPACECSTLLCQDQGSERVSVTGSQGQEAVPDARRYKSRRTKG